MTPQWPRLELLFSRDGDAWRLYTAGWRMGPLVKWEEGGVIPAPDFEDLDKFMFETDAPYLKLTGPRSVEILAQGRSAVSLIVWIEALVLAAAK